MNHSKISVVVTCYNHEAYIRACLESIFAQSYREIELLIYNDGSTDGSGEVIESCLAQSPFEETLYISEANRGLAVIKNDALTKIRGDYLLFVDSDNYLPENYLEVLLEALENEKADIAYCQLWDFQNKKNVLRDDLEYDFEKELEGNLIDSCSLVRQAMIGSVKFDEALNNKALEDYDFWLELIINNQAKAVFSKATKLNYRVLNDSRSQRGNWKVYYQNYFQILKKHQAKISPEISKALEANIKLWLDKYETLEDSKQVELAAKEQHIKDLVESHAQVLQDKEKHLETLQEQMRNALHDKDVHIETLNQEIEKLHEEIAAIYSSRSYRLGNKILHPLG